MKTKSQEAAFQTALKYCSQKARGNIYVIKVVKVKGEVHAAMHMFYGSMNFTEVGFWSHEEYYWP